MGTDVIKSLKSNLADLSYVLFILRREFELVIENTKDERVIDNLHQMAFALKDSNKSIIQFYHKINAHEAQMKSELYNDESKIQGLQKEVEHLSKSINTIIDGNKKLLESNCQ